jgi:hypothetical protein
VTKKCIESYKIPGNQKKPLNFPLRASCLKKILGYEWQTSFRASEFEEEYAQNFSEEMGAPAKTFRMALGALIIQEKLGISDRETVEQIKENPYLQYFIGENSYRNEALFDASMMVHFRQRIGQSLLQKINRKIVQQGRGFKPEEPSPKKSEEAENPKENRGKLLIDATVAPADIKYPTDVDLLN